MKKEIADLWIADLRANPPQAMAVLYNGHGLCCLGRLCVVLGYEFNAEDRIRYTDPERPGVYRYEGEVLPPPVKAAAGMNSVTGQFEEYNKDGSYLLGRELTDLNDAGRTFAEIADIIERYWEQL